MNQAMAMECDDGPKNTNSNTELALERKQRGTEQEKKREAVNAEIARVNQLPGNSNYAIHRIKVLNKLRHLMSIERTISQDEELELLFANLSI